MSEDYAPQDVHLREVTVSSEQVWQGRFLDVRRDTVALPNGAQTTREYIVHPGAVMVVPMLDDDGFKLTESSAILKYLAEKFDLPEYPKDLKARADKDGYVVNAEGQRLQVYAAFLEMVDHLLAELGVRPLLVELVG